MMEENEKRIYEALWKDLHRVGKETPTVSKCSKINFHFSQNKKH